MVHGPRHEARWLDLRPAAAICSCDGVAHFDLVSNGIGVGVALDVKSVGCSAANVSRMASGKLCKCGGGGANSISESGGVCSVEIWKLVFQSAG